MTIHVSYNLKVNMGLALINASEISSGYLPLTLLYTCSHEESYATLSSTTSSIVVYTPVSLGECTMSSFCHYSPL